jgi:hypothetical protein
MCVCPGIMEMKASSRILQQGEMMSSLPAWLGGQLIQAYVTSIDMEE